MQCLQWGRALTGPNIDPSLLRCCCLKMKLPGSDYGSALTIRDPKSKNELSMVSLSSHSFLKQIDVDGFFEVGKYPGTIFS